jgi:glutathione S-transferase/maleylpyruvate isomerase
MLTVYSTRESLYCAKLRILLRHKKTQWQEIEPQGGCGSSQYRELIPAGTLPALVDGDLVVADSEAIAEYLNETIVHPAMLPEHPRARAKCRERSRFHDTRLEPEVRKLFPYVGRVKTGSDIAKTQSQALSVRLQELAHLLATDDTLDLQRLSLGDCGFPICFAWIDALVPIMGLELEWPANLHDYRSSVEAHEAVVTELSEYAPSVQAWLASRS